MAIYRNYLLFFSGLLLLAKVVVAQPLTVAINIDPPLVMKNSNDMMLSGILVDIIQEIGRHIDREIQYQVVPYKRALVYAELGKVDAVCCPGITEERLKFLYFPDVSIIIEENVFFMKKGADFEIDESINNAAHLTLGTIRGFVYNSVMGAIENNHFQAVYPANDLDQLVKMFVHGRTDLIIGNKLTVLYNLDIMGIDGQVEMVKKAGTNDVWVTDSWPIFLAFSKKRLPNPSYLKKIDDAMREIKEYHKYGQIFSEYPEKAP